MCGINGIIGLDNEFKTRDLLVHMNTALSHRGPDDQGIFCQRGVGLGHRRLSIIDLSEQGHQPMTSADGRYKLVFNGEIYNYRELRKKLSGYEFQTQTDSEVLLALYAKYKHECLNHLDGMFAFAIWDTQERELFCARDRMGKKPFYYHFQEGVFIFSSEIRGLLRTGLIEPKINHKQLGTYLQYQTVFSPDTLVQNIKMLRAGYYMIYRGGQLMERKYWSLDEAKKKHVLTGPYDKVVKMTRELFFKAVEKRMVSDVPLGAFLSGGIDSSCVVAAMSQTAGSKIKTFHIHFGEEGFDEQKFAGLVAKKFKTEHHEILIESQAFLEKIPEAVEALDHPSSDGINTHIVSAYTKAAGITVALSGLGGDEMMGGYPIFRYMQSLRKVRFLGSLPVAMRSAMAGAAARILSKFPESKVRSMLALSDWNWDKLYPVFRQVMSDKEVQQLGLQPRIQPPDLFEWPEAGRLTTEVSIAESRGYMENILLRDTDQMSMAHALEVRVPFLDRDLVEFVLSLPDDFKPLVPQKKLIIDAMGSLLPEEVWNRQKMGFTFPWSRWIGKELKTYCEEALTYSEFQKLVPRSLIEQQLDALQAGGEVKEWMKIWNLVVLSRWMQTHGIKA